MRPILILCVLLLFQSCSWLGSKGVILQRPLQKPYKVAVIIVQDEVFESSESISESDFFTKILAEELSKKNIFRYTILNRKYSLQSFDHFQASLLGIELMDQYDAYLVCIPKRKGLNYRIELRLYQSNPTAQLISVRHNSSLGNSYWFYQPPEGTLMDATRGAVDLLDSKIKKALR